MRFRIRQVYKKYYIYFINKHNEVYSDIQICKYFGNNTLYSDEDLACCDFCKNSKRQNYECPEERTCEFWEKNERI